jgi:hypothetical protein
MTMEGMRIWPLQINSLVETTLICLIIESVIYTGHAGKRKPRIDKIQI